MSPTEAAGRSIQGRTPVHERSVAYDKDHDNHETVLHFRDADYPLDASLGRFWKQVRLNEQRCNLNRYFL